MLFLSSKVDVGRRIREAYHADDKESLQQIAREELLQTQRLKPSIAFFSHQWLKETRSLAWIP